MALRTNRLYEENINKFGSIIKIIRYGGANDIDIYFPEYNWILYNNNYDNFKRGVVKCPYESRVYGKGYFGEGPYKANINKRSTAEYRTWNHMLGRCYDEEYMYKNPTYVDCFVCDDWLNFQNFAKWYNDNYYNIDNMTMALDKDILYKGNRIYSPETCIFVPQQINSLFTNNHNIRGELPIGVKKKGNKFEAYCNNGYGKVCYVGNSDTIVGAFELYKEFKEAIIKQIADDYKDNIPYKLYEAMYNYKIEITD